MSRIAVHYLGNLPFVLPSCHLIVPLCIILGNRSHLSTFAQRSDGMCATNMATIPLAGRYGPSQHNRIVRHRIIQFWELILLTEVSCNIRSSLNPVASALAGLQSMYASTSVSCTLSIDQRLN